MDGRAQPSRPIASGSPASPDRHGDRRPAARRTWRLDLDRRCTAIAQRLGVARSTRRFPCRHVASAAPRTRSGSGRSSCSCSGARSARRPRRVGGGSSCQPRGARAKNTYSKMATPCGASRRARHGTLDEAVATISCRPLASPHGEPRRTTCGRRRPSTAEALNRNYIDVLALGIVVARRWTSSGSRLRSTLASRASSPSPACRDVMRSRSPFPYSPDRLEPPRPDPASPTTRATWYVEERRRHGAALQR